MKKWILLLPYAALVAAIACQELPTTAGTTDETSVEAPDAVMTAGTATEPAFPVSTICAALQRDIADMESQLAGRPSDAAIRNASATLRAMFTNTCE
jgi:hypothetical protein